MSPCQRLVFNTRRVCQGPGPSEVADDPVLDIRPAGSAEVRRLGPVVRRPVGGRPEVVNDHSLKQMNVSNNPCITKGCKALGFVINGFWDGRKSAKLPTFWNGFEGRRGRPDPKNRRFPAGPKTMY